MPKYASLSGNIVNNIVAADTKEMAEIGTGQTCIEFDDSVKVESGYLYDSNTNTFSAPLTEEQSE